MKRENMLQLITNKEETEGFKEFLVKLYVKSHKKDYGGLCEV